MSSIVVSCVLAGCVRAPNELPKPPSDMLADAAQTGPRHWETIPSHPAFQFGPPVRFGRATGDAASWKLLVAPTHTALAPLVWELNGGDQAAQRLSRYRLAMTGDSLGRNRTLARYIGVDVSGAEVIFHSHEPYFATAGLLTSAPDQHPLIATFSGGCAPAAKRKALSWKGAGLLEAPKTKKGGTTDEEGGTEDEQHKTAGISPQVHRWLLPDYSIQALAQTDVNGDGALDLWILGTPHPGPWPDVDDDERRHPRHDCLDHPPKRQWDAIMATDAKVSPSLGVRLHLRGDSDNDVPYTMDAKANLPTGNGADVEVADVNRDGWMDLLVPTPPLGVLVFFGDEGGDKMAASIASVSTAMRSTDSEPAKACGVFADHDAGTACILNTDGGFVTDILVVYPETGTRQDAALVGVLAAYKTTELPGIDAPENNNQSYSRYFIFHQGSVRDHRLPIAGTSSVAVSSCPDAEAVGTCTSKERDLHVFVGGVELPGPPHVSSIWALDPWSDTQAAPLDLVDIKGQWVQDLQLVDLPASGVYAAGGDRRAPIEHTHVPHGRVAMLAGAGPHRVLCVRTGEQCIPQCGDSRPCWHQAGLSNVVELLLPSEKEAMPFSVVWTGPARQSLLVANSRGDEQSLLYNDLRPFGRNLEHVPPPPPERLLQASYTTDPSNPKKRERPMVWTPEKDDSGLIGATVKRLADDGTPIPLDQRVIRPGNTYRASVTLRSEADPGTTFTLVGGNVTEADGDVNEGPAPVHAKVGTTELRTESGELTLTLDFTADDLKGSDEKAMVFGGGKDFRLGFMKEVAAGKPAFVNSDGALILAE